MSWNDPDCRRIRFPRKEMVTHPGAGQFRAAVRAGIVAVLMDCAPSAYGILAIPDEVANTYFSESGVVVGSGDSNYNEGDRVLVSPSAGLRFGVLTVGDHDFEDVRFYGRASVVRGTIEEPVADVIPGIIEGDSPDSIRAIGGWCFVRRDRTTVSEGGILLRDQDRHGTCKCTVLSVGEMVSGITEGGRYLLHPSGEVLAEYLVDDGDPERRDSYSFIRGVDLLMEI